MLGLQLAKGSLPLEGGIEAAYRKDIENSSNPKKELEKINIRLNKLRSPLRTAESFLDRGNN